MKTITFRPLRTNKKSGKVIVASYMQWNKVKCANYSEFYLVVVDEYSKMDKSQFVYNHEGELLYHYNYNPWDAFVYEGTCLDPEFSWDKLREQHGSFTIKDDTHVGYHWRGADCNGTPTFSHFTADYLGTHKFEPFDFEPLTVGYVIDWLGWFLYQLGNSKLEVKK